MEKLTAMETARVCRSLALLLQAGLPLADGAFLLAQEEAAPLQGLLKQLGERMDAGERLSDAMEASGAFPSHGAAMVRIGEETGRLEEALTALGDYFEERYLFSRQLRSAVAYPGLLLLLMLGVIGVLLVKVLPVFDQVYATLGSGLRGMAGMLLQVGILLERLLPGLLVLLLLLTMAVLAYSWCAPFRERAAGWYSRRFGDRGLSRKFNNARFARGLSMGLSSGLPLEEALALSRQLLEDVPGAAKRCRTCEALLKEGKSLADALEEAGLLPPAQCRMLAVGLRSGSADRVMEDVARQLSRGAKEALEDTMSRVEPAMVLSASVLVGLILLAVMLPLMDIMSTIG